MDIGDSLIAEELSKSLDNMSNDREKAEDEFSENILSINYSRRSIENINKLVLPLKLTCLDLSYNKLYEVPIDVLRLEQLKILDLSHNCIQYFNITPAFCFTIEKINLSHNSLKGPPYWVWSESPSNLKELDLSYNRQITCALKLHAEYYEELLQYKCLASNIKINNCDILQHMGILATFVNVKNLQIGEFKWALHHANHISEVPSQGLEKCYAVEQLNLSNLQIYSLNSNINIFKNIVEIDLSQNRLRSLPAEFCDLETLEICNLSHNYILYLPDEFIKLVNLKCLLLNNNELCMLPQNLTQISSLRIIDLYSNALYEVSEDIYNLEEVDVAQNYFDEPECEGYLYKCKKIRSKGENNRLDGRKPEPNYEDSEHSPNTSDDESYMKSIENKVNYDNNADSSESEDWDSDDYWIPHKFNHTKLPTQSAWFSYIERKMAEGNFCPMDAHTPSVADIVTYEKMHNPTLSYESEGQFDDLSEEDS